MSIMLAVIQTCIIVFVVANRAITIIGANEKRIQELERFFSAKVIDSFASSLEKNLQFRSRVKRWENR